MTQVLSSAGYAVDVQEEINGIQLVRVDEGRAFVAVISHEVHLSFSVPCEPVFVLGVTSLVDSCCTDDVPLSTVLSHYSPAPGKVLYNDEALKARDEDVVRQAQAAELIEAQVESYMNALPDDEIPSC